MHYLYKIMLLLNVKILVIWINLMIFEFNIQYLGELLVFCRNLALLNKITESHYFLFVVLTKIIGRSGGGSQCKRVQ